MSQTQRSAPDNPRNASADPYVVFTPEDFVFTDGRRIRWWLHLASRPAALASFVVGIAAISTVAVQSGPISLGGASKLEPPMPVQAPVAKLPVSAHVMAPPRPEAKVIPPRAVTPRKPAPPPAQRPPNATLAAKTVIAPVTIVPRATTAPAIAPSAAPGWLVVSSKPWGSLYVDGRAHGTTPQTNLWLPPGVHRVEIRRPGFEPFVASVTIDSNRGFRLTRVTLTPATQ